VSSSIRGHGGGGGEAEVSMHHDVILINDCLYHAFITVLFVLSLSFFKCDAVVCMAATIDGCLELRTVFA